VAECAANRSAADLLTKDEARCIAANVPGCREPSGGAQYGRIVIIADSEWAQSPHALCSRDEAANNQRQRSASERNGFNSLTWNPME
jgi:hypothetical protein